LPRPPLRLKTKNILSKANRFPGFAGKKLGSSANGGFFSGSSGLAGKEVLFGVVAWRVAPHATVVKMTGKLCSPSEVRQERGCRLANFSIPE